MTAAFYAPLVPKLIGGMSHQDYDWWPRPQTVLLTAALMVPTAAALGATFGGGLVGFATGALSAVGGMVAPMFVSLSWEKHSRVHQQYGKEMSKYRSDMAMYQQNLSDFEEYEKRREVAVAQEPASETDIELGEDALLVGDYALEVKG